MPSNLSDPAARPPSLRLYASYLVTQVAKVTSRLLSEGLARHDLRLAHFGVLAALDDLGPSCQRQLCDVLDLDKSHMVGFVDDLERRGLVDRDRDPQDRRRHRISINDAGRSLLVDLHDVEARCQAEVFGVLTATEHETLVDLLRRTVAAADERRLATPVNR